MDLQGINPLITLTPDEVLAILRQTTGQDEAIFNVYAHTLAKARTLRMSDIRADGKGRFWLRVFHRNNTETWHEITRQLVEKIFLFATGFKNYSHSVHPVFASPRHPERFYSDQELNRKLRRYARLAGVNTDIRIQALRGVLKKQEPVETKPKNLGASVLLSRRHDPRLHGIGRRKTPRK